MQHWRSILNEKLLPAVRRDPFWHEELMQIAEDKTSSHSVHLAVFVQPYLQYILDGSKTIESRFSMRRFAPYDQVKQKDIILLKEASGPVVGICQVRTAWFYELEEESWCEIRQNYTKELCAQDPQFWRDRNGASFATLIRISHVLSIAPFSVEKRDRRGWVVLYAAPPQMKLQFEQV
jgi:hypothetical protein